MNCTKRPYPSRADAKRALGQYSGKRDAGHTYGPLAPYRCQFCDHWHLGHKPRTRRPVGK